LDSILGWPQLREELAALAAASQESVAPVVLGHDEVGWTEVVAAMFDDDDPTEASNLGSIPPHITCHTSRSAEPESVAIVAKIYNNAVELIL